MSKIETTVLAVRDLASNERFAACDDPHHLLDFPPSKLKTYVSNPFLPSLDAPCRLIGIKDGTVVGCRNSFPGKFVADGKVCDNRISGSVYVDPRCRSSLYAIKMLQQALKFPGGEVNINCWMSRQNQKFYRLLGACMIRFEVFDTGGRWSRYLQKVTSPRWRAFAAFFANRLAAFANAFFDGRRWRDLPDWAVHVTDHPDDQMLAEACEFVRLDPHRYRQEITPEWIRWTLENDFKKERRKSFVRVCENGSSVGFALVRIDDRAKFGKIYEWQTAPQFRGRRKNSLPSLLGDSRNTAIAYRSPLARTRKIWSCVCGGDSRLRRRTTPRSRLPRVRLITASPASRIQEAGARGPAWATPLFGEMA